MPAKGQGSLQIKGRSIADILSNMLPSPFTNQTLEYWAYVPYVTNEDYNIIEPLLQNNTSLFLRWQIRRIIKYAKENLK